MKLRLSDPQARFSPCRIHTPPIKTIRRPTRLLTTRITELNKPHTPHLQNLPQAHLSLFLNAPVVPNSQSDTTERTKPQTVSSRIPLSRRAATKSRVVADHRYSEITPCPAASTFP